MRTRKSFCWKATRRFRGSPIALAVSYGTGRIPRVFLQILGPCALPDLSRSAIVDEFRRRFEDNGRSVWKNGECLVYRSTLLEGYFFFSRSKLTVESGVLNSRSSDCYCSSLLFALCLLMDDDRFSIVGISLGFRKLEMAWWNDRWVKLKWIEEIR